MVNCPFHAEREDISHTHGKGRIWGEGRVERWGKEVVQLVQGSFHRSTSLIVRKTNSKASRALVSYTKSCLKGIRCREKEKGGGFHTWAGGKKGSDVFPGSESLYPDEEKRAWYGGVGSRSKAGGGKSEAVRRIRGSGEGATGDNCTKVA